MNVGAKHRLVNKQVIYMHVYMCVCTIYSERVNCTYLYLYIYIQNIDECDRWDDALS